MSAYPSAMLLGHLQLLGRWCPGHRCAGHPAEILTARVGRVLCDGCTAVVESERRATAEEGAR